MLPRRTEREPGLIARVAALTSPSSPGLVYRRHTPSMPPFDQGWNKSDEPSECGNEGGGGFTRQFAWAADRGAIPSRRGGGAGSRHGLARGNRGSAGRWDTEAALCGPPEPRGSVGPSRRRVVLSPVPRHRLAP